MDEITGFNQITSRFKKALSKALPSGRGSLIQKIKQAAIPSAVVKIPKNPSTLSIKKAAASRGAAIKKAMVKRNIAQAVKTAATTMANRNTAISVSDLRNAKLNPNVISKLNAVQRSFLKADLPYQPIARVPQKELRIKYTPFKLPVNVNMIEPPVDGGVRDYYGK